MAAKLQEIPKLEVSPPEVKPFADTRQNRLLTVNGQTLSVYQWAIRLKVKRSTLYNRLFTGWTPEETILMPIGQRV